MSKAYSAPGRDNAIIGHFRVPLYRLFQSESKCETSLMKMTLICMKMKLLCRTHFHKKGFELTLVLKQRLKRTRKWPIGNEFKNWIQSLLSMDFSQVHDRRKTKYFSAFRRFWFWAAFSEVLLHISICFALFTAFERKFKFLYYKPRRRRTEEIGSAHSFLLLLVFVIYLILVLWVLIRKKKKTASVLFLMSQWR